MMVESSLPHFHFQKKKKERKKKDPTLALIFKLGKAAVGVFSNFSSTCLTACVTWSSKYFKSLNSNIGCAAVATELSGEVELVVVVGLVESVWFLSVNGVLVV